MEWILFFTLWGLVGSIIGRMLFRIRLGNSARWEIGQRMNDWGEKRGPEVVISTFDMSSAQNYGLWSILFWPLTTAIFLIQAPTPAEKQAKREIQLQELLDRAETLTKELSR